MGDERAAGFDAVVVGAGFGGLGCALSLAEGGAKVLVCEALNYAGGCASTFKRGGTHFEAGATLFSGFGPGQLFERWMVRHALEVTVDWLDPVVSFRSPGLSFDVPASRETFIQRLCALPGAPVPQLTAFFAYQRRVADALWRVLDEPRLLPPFGLRELGAHIARAHEYAPVLQCVGRPLVAVLERFGLRHFEPLRVMLDALCQITIQCSSREAEAPMALSTMDYYFRGTGHVRGGIGKLCDGLVSAIERCGGRVWFSNRVKAVRPAERGWRVETRRGVFFAPNVVLNTLPQNVAALVDDPEVASHASLARLGTAVESGYGAAMLYAVVDPPAALAGGPHHLEAVAETAEPFLEGNHIFCSLSGPLDGPRAAGGLRTMTVSTHLPLSRMRGQSPEERGDYIARVQQRMRQTMASVLPDLARAVRSEMTASPRTFERFTGRAAGMVGGPPRRAGLHHYRDVLPVSPAQGLYVVGDSVFPGQSTLAAATGGAKVASVILKNR
jgi:phytoene dehydrogenase-like protein